MGRPSPFSHTAADGFGFVANSHGDVRGSELGQAKDSCALSSLSSDSAWSIRSLLGYSPSLTSLQFSD